MRQSVERTPLRDRPHTGGLRLAGAVLLTAALSGCSLLPQEVAEPKLDVITPQVTQPEQVTIRRGDIQVKQKLDVTFGSKQQASLYFTQGGRISGLGVALGQRVEAGALLAELEPGSLPYNLAQAQIAVQRAQVMLDQANSKVGFVGEPTAADLKLLQIGLQQAQLEARHDQELLDATRLYAPYTGTIIGINAGKSDTVKAYDEVVAFAGDGPPVARAKVDQVSATQLSTGQEAELYPNDGNPLPVKAVVSDVSAQPSATGQEVVTLTPVQPSDRLRVGQKGTAEVVLRAKQNVLLVPLSAVTTYGGRSFVTRIEGNTRIQVAVTLGLQNDAYAEVLTGLADGDQVVGR